MKKIIVTTIFYLYLVFPGVSVSGSQSVLIQNTTIMTVSDSGILENTDLLIENGKITAIGTDIAFTKETER